MAKIAVIESRMDTGALCGAVAAIIVRLVFDNEIPLHEFPRIRCEAAEDSYAVTVSLGAGEMSFSLTGLETSRFVQAMKLGLSPEAAAVQKVRGAVAALQALDSFQG